MTYIIIPFISILLTLSKAAIFSTGKINILNANKQANKPDTSITIQINTETDTVQFHMITYTPTIVWSAFGFEPVPYNPSNFHDNTYAIILQHNINFEPIVTEYTLGYKSKGIPYSSPEITIISDSTYGESREVIVTRPIIGMFTFPEPKSRKTYEMIVTSAVHFNAIRYDTSLRHRENPHERNFTTVKFRLLDAILPTTQPPTHLPSTTPKPSIANPCCQCTKSTVNSGCNIDPECEQRICMDDSLCCDSKYSWDEMCACEANNICNAPPTPAPTTLLPTCCACTMPNAECSDKKCEEIICQNDDYCCSTEWDGLCAPQAQDICILGLPTTTMDGTVVFVTNVKCTPRSPTTTGTLRATKRSKASESNDGKGSKGFVTGTASKSSKHSRDSSSGSNDSSEESKEKTRKRKGKKSSRKKRDYVIADNDETHQQTLETKGGNIRFSIVYICVCVLGGIGLVMIGMFIWLKCCNDKSDRLKEHVVINNNEFIEDENEDSHIEIDDEGEGTFEENESFKI